MKDVKLLVSITELTRLNKWSDTCYGEQLQATPKLSEMRWEVIYRFGEGSLRKEFLSGLPSLFGSTVEVISQ